MHTQTCNLHAGRLSQKRQKSRKRRKRRRQLRQLQTKSWVLDLRKSRKPQTLWKPRESGVQTTVPQTTSLEIPDNSLFCSLIKKVSFFSVSSPSFSHCSSISFVLSRYLRFISQNQRTMTATDVTGFCAFVLRPEIGQFSPHFWGDFLSKLHRNPGESAPKLQISVPCRGRMCPETFSQFPWAPKTH